MKKNASNLFFENFYLPKDGWCRNILFELDSNGRIAAYTIANADKKSLIQDCWSYYAGIFGFSNQHSHTYQYGMAGLTEFLQQGKEEDHFWSWRESLYKLANSLSPEQIFQLAEASFLAMLKKGYTRVTEFHYLHNDKDGKPFSNPAELSIQIMAAADKVGIDLVLLPIYYRTSNFGVEALKSQSRFISKNLESFWRLVEAAKFAAQKFERVQVFHGLHSLRAASTEEATEILSIKSDEIHIHVAEQVKEVADCLAYLSTRPVRWLLDNIDLGSQHHLVHATHIDAGERRELAKSCAKVILCPTTEANLGDGIFPFTEFLQEGGNWGIGSDSQVGIDPYEELRWLEYQQRLISGRRNPLASIDNSESSSLLLDGATHVVNADGMLGQAGSFVGFSKQLDFRGDLLKPEEIVARQIFCSPEKEKSEIILFGEIVPA